MMFYLLLLYLSVMSIGSLVHRPHGIKSLADYSSLFKALDQYGQSCQRNEGANSAFASMWHPLSMRKFINHRTGILTALKYGEHDESQHYSINDDNTDFTILSLDFISPAVCAVKCQVSVGSIRYTNMISLINTVFDQPSQENPFAWKIVQELSSSMEMTSTPLGCLLPPLPGDDDNSNEEEAVIAKISQTASTYLAGNHLSDVTMMQSCMDDSTVLFSADPVSGAIGARTAMEYYIMMKSRTSCTIPEVMQYDRIVKIDRFAQHMALVTVTLGLPHLDGRLFTDHLYMVCIPGEGLWKIVSKTWTLNQAPTVVLP